MHNPNRAGFDPIGKRHLIYHLLPVAGNGVWQRNVNELRARWHLFTGRKIIAVMTGGRFKRGKTQGEEQNKFLLVDPLTVERYLPSDAEVIRIPNDPNLREVTSWEPLWDMAFRDWDDNDAILYAHAKGVTRQPSPSVAKWTELLYSLALDHMPLTEQLLRRFPIVGSFRRIGKSFAESRSAWHYSGSFFWTRAGDVQQRLANAPIDQRWYGNEAWPGLAYSLAESGVLFKSGNADLDLFEPKTWAKLLPEYEQWLKANPAELPWATEEVA